MELDLQPLFSQKEMCSENAFCLDISKRDFGTFSVQNPLQVRYRAEADNGDVSLWFSVQADLQAECARCMQPLSRTWVLEQTFRISPQDLKQEFPELPFTSKGALDLEELSYGELLMDVDSVLLCKDTCAGLCLRCGQKKEDCDCKEEKIVDPRWQALLGLRDDEDTKF